MNRRIELRAMVQRGGRILVTRRKGGPWDLPGGSFDDDADDVDAAMDSLLRESGIVSANPSEAFLRTSYHRDGDTSVVLNLYALSEPDWMDEGSSRPEGEQAWVAPEEAVAMDLAGPSREALAVVLGLSDEREPELPTDLLNGTHESAQELPAEQTRRLAGLDVLRTLSGSSDPVAAFEAMSQRMPELAGDVVDFAFGEIWSGSALDRRTRSLEVVAMLAALGGRTGALRSHINGALNHGATAEQLTETLRMVAVYAGFPAAIEAWSVMEDVFRARGIPRGAQGTK